MKKYLAAAVLATFVFMAPSFATANPFVDVPPDHWAHDAVSRLTALGVLSGYTGNTYRGDLPSTRYEIAYFLARNLAVMDINKADKEDLEVLRRLVAEFRDELGALGVKSGALDERIAVMEDRLNGWYIRGQLLMDVESRRSQDRSGDLFISTASLYLDRWFGERDNIHFHTEISSAGTGIRWKAFYVEFPTWFDTFMTVGRFNWNFERRYSFFTGGVSDLSVSSFLTDRDYEGFGISKYFALGEFRMYVQRQGTENDLFWDYRGGFDAWEATAVLDLQFTEWLGADLGIQYLRGDDASVISAIPEYGYYYDDKFNSMYTLFGGLRLDFTDDIGLRGVYYHQKASIDTREREPDGPWESFYDDSSIAYRLILDVKQSLLGFTSLWLAYDFMERDFWPLKGNGFLVFGSRDWHDMRTWRLGATQQWDSKWRSWAYFARHTLIDFENYSGTIVGNVNGIEWGAGVEYRYNPYVAFALNYVSMKWDDANDLSRDDYLIRFRTQIDF